MSTSTSPTAVLAVGVRFSEDSLHVQLSDGREISAPLVWFPLLRDATPEQRKNLRFIGGGVGIHWDEIDEDVSVAGLLRS